MIAQQEWNLSTARARVQRLTGCTLVDVEGVVTAQAFERLHMELSRERRRAALWVVLDWSAHMACTNRSAVAAAVRGTPVGQAAQNITLLVPAARLRWAREHCALMSASGLCREAWALRQDSIPAAAAA